MDTRKALQNDQIVYTISMPVESYRPASLELSPFYLPHSCVITRESSPGHRFKHASLLASRRYKQYRGLVWVQIPRHALSVSASYLSSLRSCIIPSLFFYYPVVLSINYVLCLSNSVVFFLFYFYRSLDFSFFPPDHEMAGSARQPSVVAVMFNRSTT